MKKELYLGTRESYSLKSPIEIINYRKFKVGHRLCLICDLAQPIYIPIDYTENEKRYSRIYLIYKYMTFQNPLAMLNIFPIECYVYYEIRQKKLKELKKMGRTGVLLWGTLYNNYNQAKRDIDENQREYDEYFSNM